MNDPNLARFRDFLIVEFNEDQLAELCQDIGLNYADLPGTGAYGKTRELIEIARSRHLLSALMTRARELRSDAYRNANIKDIEPDGSMGSVASVEPMAEPATADASESVLPMLQRSDPQEERTALLAALTPRARLLAVLVAALLLIVAILTIILPKQGANPSAANTPDETTLAISATQMTAEAAAMTQPTIAPAAVDTTTQTVDSTTPVSDTQPTAAPAADDAAAAVRTINDQLIEFYTGKVDADAIKPHFGTAPYRAVTTFAYTKLKRLIGVDISKGDEINVTMHYVKDPQQTSDDNDSYTVSSTEYWSYTNPKTDRSVCDTSSYVYTLAKNGDTFQVTGLKSSSTSTKCEE